MLAYKNLSVTWVAPEDDSLVVYYNVVICEATQSPLSSTVVSARVASSVVQHTFNNTLLDTSKDYVAFVQAVYSGKDSEWISSSGISVADDGTATVATSSDVSSAQEAAQAYTDATAALAEVTAKAYADGIVSDEEARAIADAQAKADAAQSAAESYAQSAADVAATTATWSGVSGTDKPDDNATVGATFGVNIQGQITPSNSEVYIASASIKGAHIEELAVDTINIAGNAVTVPLSVVSLSNLALSDEYWVTVASGTMNSEGQPIQIWFSCNGMIDREAANSLDVYVYARFMVGGAQYGSTATIAHLAADEFINKYYFDCFLMDKLEGTNGTQSVSVEIKVSNYLDNGYIANRRMIAIGTKR